MIVCSYGCPCQGLVLCGVARNVDHSFTAHQGSVPCPHGPTAAVLASAASSIKWQDGFGGTKDFGWLIQGSWDLVLARCGSFRGRRTTPRQGSCGRLETVRAHVAQVSMVACLDLQVLFLTQLQLGLGSIASSTTRFYSDLQDALSCAEPTPKVRLPV